MSACMRCEGPLVPNPKHTHWRHCPTCEPEWGTWAAVENYRIKTKPALFHKGVARRPGA